MSNAFYKYRHRVFCSATSYFLHLINAVLIPKLFIKSPTITSDYRTFSSNSSDKVARFISHILRGQQLLTDFEKLIRKVHFSEPEIFMFSEFFLILFENPFDGVSIFYRGLGLECWPLILAALTNSDSIITYISYSRYKRSCFA